MDANDIIPRFEFGFGLSYTTFSYSNLLISTSSNSSATATVSFTVTNTGTVDGTEIPQLYLTFPPRADEPKKVLRGFEEVNVAQGQSVTVTMTLTQRDLRWVSSGLSQDETDVWVCSIWDVDSQGWVRPAGQFIVLVGASSLDIRLTGVI